MKNILKGAMLLILGFYIKNGNAQSGEINFTLQSEYTTVSGQNFTTHSSLFKTDNTLEWVQTKNGFSETLSFTITGTSGSWDKNTSQGNITYSMAISGNQQCNITMTRAQDMPLYITLNFIINGEVDEQYAFGDNTISYQ